VPQVETKATEFWNPVYPNEILVGDGDEPDSAMRRRIQFVAGYFRATEDWQVRLIEENAANRTYKADTETEMTCPKCGWITRSTAAYQWHIAEEI